MIFLQNVKCRGQKRSILAIINVSTFYDLVNHFYFVSTESRFHIYLSEEQSFKTDRLKAALLLNSKYALLLTLHHRYNLFAKLTNYI